MGHHRRSPLMPGSLDKGGSHRPGATPTLEAWECEVGDLHRSGGVRRPLETAEPDMGGQLVSLRPERPPWFHSGRVEEGRENLPDLRASRSGICKPQFKSAKQ